ncbi:hypothetical protein DFH94DRAFT_732989 [Russula ochroleuca]|uniref:HIT domain-containing protein n=1 Tax=Russula ochroleuca TaxID=152965 RepID=A0A9P5MYA2_9AGAM|nr:hypothetical protein DFH94DRAFT_732989 [Russula ochroleuca]
MATPLFFSTFEVTRQAFHRTALAFAFVNFKSIVPDVLVCSTRPVPRLTDLHTDELAELIQRVGRVVERVHKADGLTIACQESRAFGTDSAVRAQWDRTRTPSSDRLADKDQSPPFKKITYVKASIMVYTSSFLPYVIILRTLSISTGGN